MNRLHILTPNQRGVKGSSIRFLVSFVLTPAPFGGQRATPNDRLVRNDALWPPMETSSCLDLLGMLGEGGTLVGDCLFEICECRDVLVDDRFVDKRP